MAPTTLQRPWCATRCLIGVGLVIPCGRQTQVWSQKSVRDDQSGGESRLRRATGLQWRRIDGRRVLTVKSRASVKERKG